MSLFYIERRETPSLSRGEERVSLFYIERRETPSLSRGESVSLLYIGERLLLYKEERLSSIQRGEWLLYKGERVSLFYIERRETPSLSRGESVSLLYRRETPSLSKGESVLRQPHAHVCCVETDYLQNNMAYENVGLPNIYT